MMASVCVDNEAEEDFLELCGLTLSDMKIASERELNDESTLTKSNHEKVPENSFQGGTQVKPDNLLELGGTQTSQQQQQLKSTDNISKTSPPFLKLETVKAIEKRFFNCFTYAMS